MGGKGILIRPPGGTEGFKIGHQKQNKNMIELRLVIAAEISSVYFLKVGNSNSKILFYRIEILVFVFSKSSCRSHIEE